MRAGSMSISAEREQRANHAQRVSESMIVLSSADPPPTLTDRGTLLLVTQQATFELSLSQGTTKNKAAVTRAQAGSAFSAAVSTATSANAAPVAASVDAWQAAITEAQRSARAEITSLAMAGSSGALMTGSSGAQMGPRVRAARTLCEMSPLIAEEMEGTLATPTRLNPIHHRPRNLTPCL